jgi:hypothetical protein
LPPSVSIVPFSLSIASFVCLIVASSCEAAPSIPTPVLSYEIVPLAREIAAPVRVFRPAGNWQIRELIVNDFHSRGRFRIRAFAAFTRACSLVFDLLQDRKLLLQQFDSVRDGKIRFRRFRRQSAQLFNQVGLRNDLRVRFLFPFFGAFFCASASDRI